MYQVWVWSDEAQQYVPEYDTFTNRRIEFEHWVDATDKAADMQARDGQLRKVEYRSRRGRHAR